jgi:signal transduction histidine kinase
VEAVLPPDLPPVAAPATTVESVLAILLQNSRQAGATRADIRAQVTGAEVVLSVRDDGPGVPEADRERMFEPFFTSRRADGGTGLGLPIARSLLSASHGRIELADAPKGAAFRIVLPMAEPG